MALHYSARFRVEPSAGAFRADVDSGPTAEALRHQGLNMRVSVERGAGRAPRGLQELVDRFQKEAGARIVAGALPVHVTFPNVGPSLFLASELTAETAAPVIELTVRRIS
jgi:hypothetical protein